MAAPKYYNSSQQLITPVGSELITLDNGYPQEASATISSILNLFGIITQTNTSTSSFTASTALVGGTNLFPAGSNYVLLTGTLGANATLTTPTVAAMRAAFPNWAIGQSYELLITNAGSGYSWTLTAGSGWTLAGGSNIIANNTQRTFIVTLTSATAITATMTSVATYS